jgi:hypothetical protein
VLVGTRAAPALTGSALLARVRAAYRNAGGAIVTSSLGGLSVSFTMLLDRGTVVGEEFVGRRGGRTTTIVAPPGAPTFALDSGARCWRRIGASEAHTLTDLGEQFPPAPRAATVESPQATSGGWLLTLVSGGTSSTFAIDGSRLTVGTITVSGSFGLVTERVRTLTTPVKLATPAPVC